jgi:hypothetical protein
MHPKAPTSGSTERQRRISLHSKGNIMTIFSKFLVGVAGAGIAAVATPAAAQYYPPPPPPYNQPYDNQGGVVGQVLNQVLGGGRYGAYGQGQDRSAVDQCARAAEVRVSQDSRRGVYGAYNQGYGNGYGSQGYYPGYGRAQVVGITGVERRQGGLKVTGLIDTRMGQSQSQYGAYGQYGQPYPSQGYPNPGYGNPGYGNQAYAAQFADLRFSCRIDQRGRITDLDIRRNRRG